MRMNQNNSQMNQGAYKNISSGTGKKRAKERAP
jgi:hypothetical protein